MRAAFAKTIEMCYSKALIAAGQLPRCSARIMIKDDNGRRVEVIASGLPCYHGAQLAVDITLRSVLDVNGEAQPNSAAVNGAIAECARADKERA